MRIKSWIYCQKIYVKFLINYELANPIVSSTAISLLILDFNNKRCEEFWVPDAHWKLWRLWLVNVDFLWAVSSWARHTMISATCKEQSPQGISTATWILSMVIRTSFEVVPSKHWVGWSFPDVCAEWHCVVPARAWVVVSTGVVVTSSHGVGRIGQLCWHAITKHMRKGVAAGSWIRILCAQRS